MRIEVACAELERGIRRCAGVISKNMIDPVMASVLITAEQTPEGGRVTISATDLFTAVSSIHPCDVHKSGSVLVSFDVFSKLSARLPENVVSIASGARFKVELASGKLKASLAGLDPDTFPSMAPADDDAKWMPIASGVLASLIDQTKHAIGKEPAMQQQFQGLHLVASKGQLMAEATDLKRAAQATVMAEGIDCEADTIIGDRGVLAMRALLDGAAELPTYIWIGPRLTGLKREGMMFVARPIDATFPDMSNVGAMGLESPTLTVNRARLLETLNRITTVAAGDEYLRITMTTEGTTLTVAAEDPNGNQATEELALDADTPLNVKLASKAAIDALKACPSELVRIAHKQSDVPDPMTIRPVGGQNATHLIMPFVTK